MELLLLGTQKVAIDLQESIRLTSDGIWGREGSIVMGCFFLFCLVLWILKQFEEDPATRRVRQRKRQKKRQTRRIRQRKQDEEHERTQAELKAASERAEWGGSNRQARHDWDWKE